MLSTDSDAVAAPRSRAGARPSSRSRPSAPDPEPPPRLRVVLADDHAILREGLALMVGSHPDIDVVAQARGGREALQLAGELQPDVLVLDVSMPDLGGPEVAEQLRELCPRTRILALTRHADPGYLRRMLRAGAHGYVVKRAATDTLLGAIRVVADGGSYVDPAVAGAYITRSVAPRPDPQAEPRGTRQPLSEREEQVLRLIAWGKSNKEVAAQLGISVKTAEFYKASGLEKLRLRTRTDILRYALAEGWLGEEDDPE